MRIILALVLVFWVAPARAEPLRIDLGARFYLIDLPDDPSGAMIVALHAAARSAQDMRKTTDLSPRALAKGYAVIYPQATGGTQRAAWNGFYCCGDAQVNQVDDMGFLDKVIADAIARFGLAADRVYLTGMSNGAVMAQTYALRRAGGVKAVASVAGTMDIYRTRARAVPMLHIHGTLDRIVPYGKGYGTKHLDTPFTPVADQIAAVVKAFGGLKGSSRQIDRVKDGTSLVEDDYTDAAGVTQVRLLTVVDGQHVWPEPGRRGAGNTQDISATAEVLRFFESHP